MPSLRKRVSSYFRQLSFHNEPRDKKNNINENAFVTKYLQGLTTLREGPPIIYGKNPTDLPNYELGKYDSGTNTVIGCYSGPNGGLTTVKRTEKHLSVPDDDIDFIDNPEEEPIHPTPKKSPIRVSGQPIDNTTMVIKVAGHEYCVTNKPKRHSKSLSLGSISDFNIEIEKTKIDKEFYSCDTKKDENSNNKETMCKENQNDCDSNGCAVDNRRNLDKQSKKTESKGQVHHVVTNLDSVNITKTIQKEGTNSRNESHGDNSSARSRSHNKAKTLGHSSNPNYTKEQKHHQSLSSHHKVNINTSKNQHHPEKDISSKSQSNNKNYALSKSRSDGAPFQNKKRGKLIQIQRPQSYRGDDSTENNPIINVDDSVLPPEWNRKSDHYFGVSDSLYDRNQVTKHKNGDPIADCFGVIARNDSAILAVADGVNWGEKASVAAKSAVHASLHYLNKTIFNDTKPFEKLTTKTDEVALTSDTLNPNENMNLIANTREVFVCLLRAFNCAHDLILENKGMLTTLTVAVILPLKQKTPRTENGVRISNCEPHYVCCVCNVGDTLAYVYSQKYGIRELTKGSHDVNSNRDMRDALGALGPVDGINPELSNLTVSITTLNKGDLIMVASDGLTDNFDPNVCRFTVNSNIDPSKSRVKKTSGNVVTTSHQSSSQQHSQERSHHSQKRSHHSQQPSQPTEQNIQHSSQQSQLSLQHSQPEIKAQSSSCSQSGVNSHKTEEITNKPPVKPPRRSKNRGSVSSASTSERSSSSVESDVKLNNLQQQGISVNNQEHLTKPSLSQPPVEDTDNTKTKKQQTEYENPLVAQFMRENSLDDSKPVKSEVKKPPPVMENKASSLRKQASSQTRHDSARKLTPPLRNTPKTLDTSRMKQDTVGYKFLKSKTALDLRSSHASKVNILRNDDGIPYITPIQRYELQLLLMEDILKNGISGRDSPITTAKKLCENLVSFTLSITSAKRRTLEDQDMYFDNRNGVLVEVSSQEKKLRRKRGLEKVQSLPGKLDHVTVVAYNVGNFSF